MTKDIPDYSIAVGNPAKVIKTRFDKDTVEKLLKLEWWNLEINELNKYIGAKKDFSGFLNEN